MSGATTQLMMRGTQNLYLDIKPHVYLFKTKYKKHSGFAFHIDEICLNTVSFGEMSTCFLSKDVDLITNITLRIQLPSLNIKSPKKDIRCTKNLDLTCFCENCNKTVNDAVFGYANSIGHVILDEYSFNVGAKTIDKRTGEWLEWWSEHAQTAEKKAGYWEMIGKREPASFKPTTFSTSQDLLVPLEFYFTGKLGHSFPMCALNEDSISINIKWSNFDKCWISSVPGSKPSKIPHIKASLLVESVFLDQGERENFIKSNHLYLIDQVQKNGPFFFNAGVSKPNIELRFYNTVKSVYWGVRRADLNFNTDENDQSFGNDWFNLSCFKSRSKNIVLDPIETAQIFLDGSAREIELPAKYYRLLQSYYRHTKTSSNYIYCYSFAASPEDSDPSGCCNMSMFKNIRLRLNMSKNYPSAYEVIVYALSQNFLIIKNGKVAIAFAN